MRVLSLLIMMITCCSLTAESPKPPQWVDNWKIANDLINRKEWKAAKDQYIHVIEEVERIDSNSRILISLYKDLAEIYGTLGEKGKQKECLYKSLNASKIVNSDVISVQKSLNSLGDKVKVDTLSQNAREEELASFVGEVTIYSEEFPDDSEMNDELEKELKEQVPFFKNIYTDTIGKKRIIIMNNPFEDDEDACEECECSLEKKK